MDFNLDGYEDFVYSCPGTGKINKDIVNNYEGKIVIILGNNKGNLTI